MTTPIDAAVLTLPVSDRDHSQGPVDAPVTLVEYGDYECPHCGMAYPIIHRIQQRLGDRLRSVYRHFPLVTIHPHAEHAAEAAESAAARRKFWQMHEMLFSHQDRLDDPALALYAGRLGLDIGAFVRELAEHEHTAHVREDFLSGVHSGVNGTPTFFINGVRHDGSWDEPVLLAALMRAGGW